MGVGGGRGVGYSYSSKMFLKDSADCIIFGSREC